MFYYSKYSFIKRADKVSEYILDNIEGCEIDVLKIDVYKSNDEHDKLGISGKPYVIFSVPRSPSMRRYFAYCIEYKRGEVLSSVEGLNDKKRTFGDAKNIGLRDLILIQFSDDMSRMDMYFVKNYGGSKSDKMYAFQMWNDGDKLEVAQ